MNVRSLLAVCAIVTAAACTIAQEKSPPSESTGTVRLKEESTRMLGAAREFTAEKAKEYRALIDRQLKDLEPQIAELKKKAEDAGEKTRARLAPQLEQLEQKHAALRKKMDKLSTSTREAWGDVSKGMDAAMDDLKKAYKDAKSRF